MEEGDAEGLRAVGVSEEQIDAALAQEQEAEPEQEDFEVYEDCWDSVMFFLRVQRQWLYRGMDGQRAGLNHTAVEATMRMCGVKRAAQAALLDDLQVMERTVLEVEAKRAETKGA